MNPGQDPPPAATTTSPFDIAPIGDADVDAVIALWRDCGLTRPWNDPAADIAFARRTPCAEIFVGGLGKRLVASAMCGNDGHRGWLYYVAVDPGCRQAGLGRRMVEHAEEWLKSRGVPKVELMIREENAAVKAFYEAAGYGVEPRVVMSRWLTPPPE